MKKPRTAAIAALAILALSAGPVLAAITGLPADGTQVNKDGANGIDPTKNGGHSDVAGGSLAAGGTEVPWIAFEQKATVGRHIFVRSFAAGAWTTRGQSLNIDTSVKANAPTIDFAGPGRTVPWVTWYEPNATLGGKTQIFASRFCATANAVCGAGNIWVPEGRDRSGGSLLPSLNIHKNEDAENPSVAGGTLSAGGDPGPWVAWQEQDGNIAASGNHNQIFVSKPIKNATSGAACPAGTKPAGGNSVAFFCWQQVGLERLRQTGSFTTPTDPTLNIDPSREGVEPGNAFTGPSDTVPWVVWYEEDPSHIGLRNNQQVFAAKMVANGAGDGGGAWQAVGRATNGLTETLDNSGAKNFGDCAASIAKEDACSLNKVASHDALEARVAAGTLVSGNPTVPWVVWSEDVGGGKHAIFISRLVGGDHFELFNGGQPISNITRDAHNPDIEFLANEPAVSWVEDFPNGHHRDFIGHFIGGAASPSFVLDTPNGVHHLPATTPVNTTGAHQPISSTCQANPFTGDGSACPGGSGFTFFSFTTQGTPKKIFAQRE
jgi:hypothetical protein